jgi:hypothetical protein
MPMSELPQPDTLFLDASKVRFLLTASEPSDDIPYMDIDLEEGDLRSQATLAYDFTKKSWYGAIRQSETEDGMFDKSADATKAQMDILLAAIPQERMDRIAELQQYFDENSSFPRALKM